MADDIARDLAEGQSVFLIGPAGCGKTQVIANAIKTLRGKPQLVLTHTHAGVFSLRHRLRSLEVPSDRYRVDTVAGFALRWAASYPGTSGLSTATPTGASWNEVYPAATSTLSVSLLADIIANSYDGVFVDEYQDCTVDQHELVMLLASTIPTRVVGDPLQGIFDFAGETVDFDKHVRTVFEELPQLSTPYRWLNTNPRLGDWLLEARATLEIGRDPDYSSPAVRVARRQDVIKECHTVASRGGSVVGIRKWARDAHGIASRLNGVYTSMEELECRDLVRFAQAVESSNGPQRSVGVIKFASSCMTKVSTELKSASNAFSNGRRARTRRGSRLTTAVDALNRVADSDDYVLVIDALVAIESSVTGVLYRRELFREALSVLRRHLQDPTLSLSDTVWEARNKVRYQNRKMPQRTISRTLLIKGLEFDHSIVLDSREMDGPNLYVAMTRGSNSLTVLV